MKAYLDTSAVIAIFQIEPQSSLLLTWLKHNDPSVHFSDFGALEFFAVVSRHVRTGKQDARWAGKAAEDFEIWRRNAIVLTVSPSDVSHAERLVRDYRTKLAAPDALHLAISASAGTTLVTFDKRLAEAAHRHGLPVLLPA